jgi:hypothetical protein
MFRKVQHKSMSDPTPATQAWPNTTKKKCGISIRVSDFPQKVQVSGFIALLLPEITNAGVAGTSKTSHPKKSIIDSYESK